MTIIETDRLTLRAPTPEDAEFYAALENNPRVKRFIGGPSGLTANRYRQNIMLSNQKENSSVLTVAQRTSGTIIGRAGILGPDNHEIELHCVLAEEYWGQGLGYEIVNSLIEHCRQLFPGKRIVGKIHPENTVSIQIIEALGFRETALVQSDDFDNGFRKFILE